MSLSENLLELKKKELLSTLEPQHISNDSEAHLNQPVNREIKTSGEVTEV